MPTNQNAAQTVYESYNTEYTPSTYAPPPPTQEQQQSREEAAKNGQSAIAPTQTEQQQEPLTTLHDERDSFTAFIDRYSQRGGTSTGYAELNRILNGGLYSGLYCIGAVSSLGKTTFALNVCYNAVCASNHDVLFFSLEMSRNEIIAKLLSRISRLLDFDKNDPRVIPLTTAEIMTKHVFSRQATQQEAEKAIQAAGESFWDRAARRFHVVEGLGDIGTVKVGEYISRYRTQYGRSPIVVIDYLQILAAPEPHMTDKQIVDRNVFALKRLSREYDTPIIVISSFNRESYNSAVTLSCFKESGAIEYSADVLMGLQYKGICEKYQLEAAKEENRKKLARGELLDIVCRVLKNRNGMTADIDFGFDPRYNLFTPAIFESRTSHAMDKIQSEEQPSGGLTLIYSSPSGKTSSTRKRR